MPKDEVEAVNWYRKSAERGYIGGQLNLGFMYENGLGVPETTQRRSTGIA